MMPISFLSHDCDEVNGLLYRSAALVPLYATIQLHPPEAIALVHYREEIQGCRVLDMGCGAGRLTTYLRLLTDDYSGLDISPHMIAYCRQRFPELSFFQGDIRQLPFADGCFATVFAVFNLFDIVAHDDRLKVLAEVHRVLKPGGLLIFSAHNRNWATATQGPQLDFRLNPLAQLRCVRQYLREMANHRRIKPRQHVEKDYALWNDAGHDYAVLHYYIDRDTQSRQLAGAGFRLLECLDELGRTLGPQDDDSAYSSLHYVARSVV